MLEPMHELLTELPLLGDTTANQALIFSPAFLPQNITEPTYPNYTLPSANNPFPDSTKSPSVFPNFTLIVGPTAAFPDFNATSETFSDGSPLTACSIKSRGNITINSNTSAIDTSLVLRDTKGWRTQWFFSGLQPLTNYTVFVIQDDVKVSGPINIVTKSGKLRSWFSFFCVNLNTLFSLFCVSTRPLTALLPRSIVRCPSTVS